jgi:alanyl-tRNA synthetase
MAEQPNTAQPDAVQTQPDEAADRTAGEQQPNAGTLTQDQVNAIVQSRLADERRRIQSQYGDLDELKALKEAEEERRQAEMSEVEKLQAQMAEMKAKQAEAERKAQEAELNTLRLRVGQELGLPSVMAERLRGADAEELKADAQTLLEALKLTGQPVRIPNADATAGMGSTTAPSVKLTPGQQAAARAAGMTDDDYAKALSAVEGM